MTEYQKIQKNKRRKNLFRKWHRRIGFTAALFLVNLAVTGILINHSDDLELHKKFITSNWIVNSYGIKAPNNATCIKKLKLCQIDDKVYLNKNLLISNVSPLIGLVEYSGLYYLASSKSIYLLTKQFELIEIIDQQSGLPQPILQIGLSEINLEDTGITHINQSEQALLIKTEQGYWKLNHDEMLWQSLESPSSWHIKPYEPDSISFTELEQESLIGLQSIYLDTELTYLKFIQDLHSLRILSFSGKLLTDLFGIVIILLVLSGFLAWKKRTVNPS